MGLLYESTGAANITRRVAMLRIGHRLSKGKNAFFSPDCLPKHHLIFRNVIR